MSHFGCAILVGLILAITAPTLRAATPAEIQTAIDKAKAYLYSTQFDGCRWERDAARVGNTHDYWNVPQADSWGGWTALCTYALLVADEKPSDPRVGKPIQFLRENELIGVYAISLRANVWNLLPSTEENRRAAQRDADLLLRGMNRANTPQRGLYHYTTEGGGIWHNSTTQYAVLGMWAASQAQVEIPRAYWQTMDDAWRRNQHADGGWTYHVPNVEGQTTTLGLSAAGVASLFITQEMLRGDAGSNCKGNVTDAAIERGMKWVAGRFNPNVPLYDLFAMERIGLASGYRYFGQRDWYAEGAEALVRSQQPDGSWATQRVDGMMPVTNTAQALIFLCRGRAPVVLHKLQYDIGPKPGNWNQRPRDAAHFTQWLSKQLERDLNWQIVNFDTPVETMLESPILYLAGNQRLVFSAEQKAKLKAFVEAGGLILGNSDCGNADFTTSFKKLGQELFPAYEFCDLPKDHILFTQQLFKIKAKPVVLGLSNGVREMMICIPQADPARYWEIRSRPELSQLAANIVLYAVEKRDLRYKGERYIVTPSATTKPAHTIKLARLPYPGNSDPEPGGWRRLAAHALNTRGVQLTAEPVQLGSDKLSGYTIAHLTGTTPVKFNDVFRAELRRFLDAGGTLIVDAAGGSMEFALSMETELQTILGRPMATDPLPADHRIYMQPASPIKNFAYREFARGRLGQLNSPRIRATDVNGRPAIFFSAEDLSAGLVGQSVDGITGYTPKTATAIMTNLVTQGAP
jgi:hypothetical protein